MADRMVVVNEDNMNTIYSNAIEVNASYLDFSITFGVMSPARSGLPQVIQGITKVYLSPQQMKLLAGLLVERVSGYEDRFGVIPDPPQGAVGRASVEVSIEAKPPAEQPPDGPEAQASPP